MQKNCLGRNDGGWAKTNIRIHNKWTFTLYCIGMEVWDCRELICWLVYPLCLSLAICLFSASMAVASRSIYTWKRRRENTSKKRGTAVTSIAEMAIQAIIPATFPAYRSLQTPNTDLEGETDEIVHRLLAVLHKSRVHRLVHSNLQLFLDITTKRKPHAQADFFPLGAIEYKWRAKENRGFEKRGDKKGRGNSTFR